MWWMPAWLDKRLPHLNIEPPEAADQAAVPDDEREREAVYR
jgi:RND superfamily putative drug exporter